MSTLPPFVATPPGPPPSGSEGLRVSRLGIVGSGWRAEYFARMARLMPDRFAVTGVVTRSADRGEQVAAEWRVPTTRTVAGLLDLDRPDYVVVAVPWEVTPVTTAEVVRAGVPVLAETPPAPDLPGLRDLWLDVGDTGLVQVAEHSPYMPMHAARMAVLRSGAIGQVTQVQVSSTHMYHAQALIRTMLGIGSDPVDVCARRFTAPLLDPMTKAGWTDNALPEQSGTTVGLLDFGDGRSAVYDFTDNQWHNPLRVNRIQVRGSHGELLDDRVTRWVDERTVVTSTLVRRQVGFEQDLEGFDLDHISFDGEVVYRNVFAGARLADDDIAVASLMDRMAAWTQGMGLAPYPLAHGCQDHAVALAVEDAAASGQPRRLEHEVWG